MDLVSMIFGAGLVLLFVYIVAYILSMKKVQFIELDDPTDDEEFQELQDKPYCPDCGCYDLRLVDNCDGVPWLKGKVQEIDYYVCKRCGRQFNDEDWQTAKAYK